MTQSTQPAVPPCLRQQGSATQLIVAGQPFLVLGGEVHNSSSSSLDYMQPIWDRLVAFNINTVLVPVSWELLEPEEGRFDFTLVDGLIRYASLYGLHLILLWFGSWKNGTSSYAPLWVKRDTRRFPRAELQGGQPVEVLSTFSAANQQADAAAFAALMRRVREVDGDAHTVIMVQVENEVGLLGDGRDRSAAAEHAFAQPVPPEFITHLRQSAIDPGLRQRWESGGSRDQGAWQQVFGDGPQVDELFMAWHYARYIDAVTAAGKAEYDIPMYVNAWLNGAGQKPGDWPSGGPLPHVFDAWRAGASHIDLLAPDIYQLNFQEWCQAYARGGNPLFIPETLREGDGPRNVFYALGEGNAIGFSPFAVDSLDPAGGAALRRSYDLLQQLAPLILERQGTGALAGFALDPQQPMTIRHMGGYELEISLDQNFGHQGTEGCGLIMALGEDEFIGAGYGFRVCFRPTTPGPGLAGIAAVDEGQYDQGQWVAGRRLNGDETSGGSYWRFPVFELAERRVDAYLLSAGTGISRCRVYRYER